MNLIIVETKEELANKASEMIANRIKVNPQIVLGLATGGTPESTYRKLRDKNKNGEITFKDVKVFNLDEYIGLNPSHELSYRYYMNENLFDHIDIKKENTFIPSGLGNIEENAKEYEQKISELGPINFQLLGLGRNGHIGFNEPGKKFDSRTTIVDLTESTIEANSRYFKNKNDVPKHAISMGVGTILDSEEILLIAYGEDKAKAIYELIKGEYSTNVPATSLQKHPNVTIIIDKEAASLL
ncbi:MAG: glucosamine-6-phosphate deaminase [Mycoplasma sp.]|nr:glucosamine-6-phosphate deaminase [Mycoplasma sp.]